TISDEKLQEKEPPKDLLAEEKMEEAPKEEPKPVVSAAPAPAPIVREKPAVKKPIRLTEDMPKPVQLVKNTPSYPPDAKAAGIEGAVIVRYVIAEDGSVRDVKALKGPPELHAVCVEAVKTWRFQPILVDGSPVAVVRMARFPFSIR
ncbi:MAG TPA: TonB family protein, partial [Polyangiaceae bacterium]